MKKNFLVGLSTLLLIGSLAGCGKKDDSASQGGSTLDGTYDITVWVSEVDGSVALAQQQIAAFQQANPGIVLNATVEGVGEGEAATQMISDVESGADLFCFAQDQLARLVQANALNPLGQQAAATVTELNDAGSVRAATVGETLYCYPMTSDNGYFMYYDKSVIPEEHLDSLEDLVADCEAAGKNFSFNLGGSGWYNASFFFATGCKSEWKTDDAGKFVSVDDTFNSAAGLVALKGMQHLIKSPVYNDSGNGADFAAAVPSAIVVSGTWDSVTVKDILGDNFGATDLPSFTVDGQSYHLGSFSGNKLMGVKPQINTTKAAVLQKLALYMTNEESQLARFEELGWGPSNKAAQNSEAVKADVTLSALAAQSAYARPEMQVHGSWWDIAKTYVAAAKDATTDAELEAALQAYEEAINGLFSMPVDEQNAFTAIGTLNGSNWDKDFQMDQKPENVWTTTEALLLAEGDQFKVRKGKSWDESYGNNGDNFVVSAEQAGYRFIKFDNSGDTPVITLEKYNPSYSYSVIGAFETYNWDADLWMEQIGEGEFQTIDAITFAENDEFKVRYGSSWDTSYGNNGANIVISAEQAGEHHVKLTISGESVSIELL